MNSIPARMFNGKFFNEILKIFLAEEKLEDHSKKLEELEKKFSTANFGSGIDSDSLNKLMNDFMKKSEMEDILKRLEKCEKKTKKAKDNANNA